MSIPTVNITSAVDITVAALRAKVPVLCHGSPGIGKSQGWAKKVAEEFNAELSVFIPSHHDPIAINGLPAPNIKEGTTDIYMTKYFSDVINNAKAKPDKNFIIFLDEIGQASTAHQAPLMELIHEKKVAGKKLPDNCFIIAATNKITDGAMVQRMSTPLRNRFVHFELIPDRSAWLEWVAKSDTLKDVPKHIKILVKGFLEFKPDSFYTFDTKRNDIFAFATPRSWEALIRMLAVHPKTTTEPYNGEAVSKIHTLALSSIGEPVASDLSAFAATYANLPTMKDIEEGCNPALDTNDAAILYALATALISRLEYKFYNTENKDTKAFGEIKNLYEYAIEHLHKDLQVWLVKTLYSDKALRKQATAGCEYWKVECVDEFITDNLDLLV